MAVPVFDIKVQGLTFDELLSDFRELAGKLLPQWDFSNPNDPVVYLSELYLAGLDRESFFANLLAQEFALDTAQDRRSIFSHAKRLGYEPGTRQPSIVDVTLNITPSPVLRTIDPFDMIVGTAASAEEEAILFENLNLINVPANADVVTSQFIQGQTVEDTFSSSGSPFMKFPLSQRPVILEQIIPTETLTVFVDATQFTRADGFADAGPTDKVFVLDLDFDGTGFILFGDGVKGEIPSVGSAITVTYRIGGGLFGNVAQDSISEAVQAPSFVSSVNNLNPASGGTDEESSQHIKIFAPIAIREGGQLNTLDAVRQFLESKLSIARAKTFLDVNKIRAVVLTEPGFDLDAISGGIITEILDKLLMGFLIELVPPQFVEVTSFVRVFIEDNANRATVEQSVDKVIDDWLDPLATDTEGNFINNFGETVFRSTLGFLLKGVDEVFDFEIVQPTENVLLLENQISAKTNIKTTRTIEVVGGITGTGARVPRVLSRP